MRLKQAIIGGVIGAFFVLEGLVWEYPGPALDMLGGVMAALQLQDTYDGFISWIADHPQLATVVAPRAALGCGIAALLALLFGPAVWKRWLSPPLQILYDPDDREGRYIRKEPVSGSDGDSTGDSAIRFYVGLHNARRDRKTIRSVSLRVHEGEFAWNVFRMAHGRPASESDPVLAENIALDAGATHFAALFGVPENPIEEFWQHKHTFALDARGSGVKAAFAIFTFDLRASPMLRQIK